MPPHSFYPGSVPPLHTHPGRRQRQDQTPRWRALHALLLLVLVILPIQGSIRSAASVAPPNTARRAAGPAETAKVSLLLTIKRNQISTRQRARAMVALMLGSPQQTAGSGRVKVV